MTSVPSAASVVISAAHVVTPEVILSPGWVEVVGDRIVDVREGLPPGLGVPKADSVLVPGFVDLHVHGGGGASFATDKRAEAIRAMEMHLSHGTTTMFASLVTAPLEVLRRQVSLLGDLVESGVLAGVHLEGPWLSSKAKGAHDPNALAMPTPEALESLLRVAPGAIRMVTLAPELDGGLEATSLLTERGVVVAVGHTAADYDTAKAAIDRGASVATHLFNAMPPLHHREPGAALALLDDARVTVELIIDGHHVDPRLAAFAMGNAAGGAMLVTDAMAAAGATDGDYDIGGLPVKVRGGVARLHGNGSLAGSTLTMDRALRNVVHCGIPLLEAVRAASTRPAKAHGLSDVGALEVGRRADMVLLRGDLHVERVVRAGRWVSGDAE